LRLAVAMVHLAQYTLTNKTYRIVAPVLHALLVQELTAYLINEFLSGKDGKSAQKNNTRNTKQKINTIPERNNIECWAQKLN